MEHEQTLEARQKEAQALRDDLERSADLIGTAEAKSTDLESKMADLRSQLDAAVSDRLELEAKVGSASDERRTLLERCLTAESEVERARASVTEFRRKLDDSQAALQELGRENQSIQVQLSISPDSRQHANLRHRQARTTDLAFTG